MKASDWLKHFGTYGLGIFLTNLFFHNAGDLDRKSGLLAVGVVIATQIIGFAVIAIIYSIGRNGSPINTKLLKQMMVFGIPQQQVVWQQHRM